MAITVAEKHVVFDAVKEILIKTLEKTNPFSINFGTKEANEIGDVFNALVAKLTQSYKSIV